MDVMLDFNKSAAEVCAHVRAIHPWGKTFFAVGKEFITPNPHKTYVVDNNSSINTVGKAVEVMPLIKGIAIVCGDGKLVCFEGVELYRKPWATRAFLKKLCR